MKAFSVSVRTYALLAGVSLIWGLNFAIIKGSLREINPIAFCGARFALGAVMLWCIWTVNHWRPRGSVPSDSYRLRTLFVLATIGPVLFQLLFVIGIALSTAANASIITSTIPIVVAIESHIVEHLRIGKRGWVGVLVAVFALCALVASAVSFQFSLTTLAGDCLLAVATVCWGTYTFLLRRYGEREKARSLMPKTVAIGAVILVAITSPWLVSVKWAHNSDEAILGLLFSGIFAIGIAYAVWGSAIQQIGPTKTSVFSNLATAIAIATSSLLLGENVNIVTLAAFVGVALGIFLVQTDRLVTE